MRRIDIFVSSLADVQIERSLADRVIRSVAGEFNVSLTVAYSNRLRRLRKRDDANAQKENVPEDDLLLCPCFWEYQDFKSEEDYREHIPNTGQFDLVICILWSRIGPKLAPTSVMPDGSEPGSATDYEIAWALDEAKRTPGFPALRVYRNRSIPTAPPEPKEEREKFLQQWDSVREFFADWERENAFREVCKDYRGLEEFEDLFRKHFRDFLTEQLGSDTAGRRPRHHCKSNPFRGLDFFDFEHAPVFHGRTKAVGEVLDALKKQTKAKKPFVLVLGASGSGKSSLVRAGVLPILTQIGTAEGDGPWRRAVTRPAAGGMAGDPFDALVSALLDRRALPELPDAESTKGRQNLASKLREHPEHAAALIKETLDHLSLQELDHLLDEEERELPLEKRREDVRLVQQKRLMRVKPQAQLALVVDQLEGLFAGGFSPELQQRYIAALAALVRCERVFVIATLRSDFYASYQESTELVELIDSSGRVDLQLPNCQEIGNMIRLPAEAAGLRFGLDPTTGRSLDEVLLDAAAASREPLPLLEHLLSQLYQKQLARKDGLLRGSDYRELGGLEWALADHAESVFSTLKSDEQDALESVIRQLVTLGGSGEGTRRTVLYCDLVSSPHIDDRQKAGTKGLVDRLIQEGLLSASTDARQELMVSVTHEALLRRWRRLWQWLSGDEAFLRMRDRLDKSLKLWLSRGRQPDDLLGPRTGLAEAKILLADFRSSLTGTQTDYVQKSLANQTRRQRTRDNIQVAIMAGLAVLAIAAAGQWWKAEIQRKKAHENARLEREISESAENRRDVAEVQRKKAEEDGQSARKNANLAASQLGALETRLKKAEAEAQTAQQTADQEANQGSTLRAELKETQAKAQQVQKNADAAAGQRDALQTQLKDTETRVQQVQKNADAAAGQRDALQTQLKETETRVQQVQKNAEAAISVRDALQTQLKETEANPQQVQKDAELAASQRDALQTQLRDTEVKPQRAQKDAELAAGQRDTIQTKLKDTEAKAQRVQKDAELAASQRDGLQPQLKGTEAKAQVAQKNSELSASQHDALQTQPNAAEDEAKHTDRPKMLQNQRSDGESVETRDLAGTYSKAEQTQPPDPGPNPERSTVVQPLNPSVQPAQTTARSSLTPVPFGGIAEARNEEMRGATETPSPIDVDSEPTPQNKPIALDQDPVKLARTNQNQAAFPLPTPSVATSTESARPDGSVEALAGESSLKQFVLDYIRTVAIDDISSQRRFFAQRVNYYREGVLPLRRIQQMTLRFHREWPNRDWEPQGEPQILPSKNHGRYEVLVPFTWKVSNGQRHEEGGATLYFQIRKNGKGEFQIVTVEHYDRSK